MAADDAFLEPFEPLPGDEAPISRGEARRMTHLYLQRLARIEDLCFNDRLDAEGAMERPSLQTTNSIVYGHVNVMCAWAHGVIRFSKVLAALGVIGAVMGAVIHFARVGI